MTKRLVFLGILTSSIGASVIGINLGFFQLSLFRIIIFSLLVLLALNTLKLNRISNISMKKNRYSMIFMFFWLVYGIFSLLWVKDYNSWLKGVFFLGTGVACVILFTRYLRNERDVLKAFFYMSIMSIFHNIIGWYEVLTGNYRFISSEMAIIYKMYKFPVSMFGNTNDFATYLLISICLLYICIKSSNSFIIRIIYMLAIASSTVLLFMTSSRANILGLFVSAGVLVFFSVKKSRKRFLVFILLLLGIIVISLLPSIVTNIYGSIMGIVGFSGYYEGGSISSRINLIKNGFYFLFRTFGFGTGAGNIEYWMTYHSLYYTWGITNMHNWWMEILVGFGLIVFILYLIFYIRLLKDVIKNITRNRKTNTISLGLASAMFGFVVGSVSSSSNISSEWLWVFWGIVIAYQGVIINHDNIF